MIGFYVDIKLYVCICNFMIDNEKLFIDVNYCYFMFCIFMRNKRKLL